MDVRPFFTTHVSMLAAALIALPAPLVTAAPPDAPSTTSPVTSTSGPDASALKKADLTADEKLDAPVTFSDTLLDKIRHKSDAVADVLEAVSAATEKPMILLGPAALPADKMEQLSGKPARKILQALAEAANSTWQRYGAFYLLCTPTLQRHAALPVRMDKNYPELARKTSTGYSGFLSNVVRIMGATNKAITLVCVNRGFQGPGPLLPTVVAARGRTVDEIMRALTALTGNPWEHYHGMHVLSLSGGPLTEENHQNLDRLAQTFAWTRSLASGQLEQLRSENGLPLTALPPGQVQQIMTTLRPMLERFQANPQDVVLRFVQNAPSANIAGNDIYVYQVTSGRWNTIGKIPYP